MQRHMAVWMKELSYSHPLFYNDSCGRLIPIALIQHWPKTTGGKNDLLYFTFYNSSWEKLRQEFKVVTRRQELKQTSWRSTAYWFAFQGSLIFHSYSTQDICPEVAPPTTIISQKKKKVIHTSLQANMREIFSQLRSLFPDKYCLCQVDKISQHSRWREWTAVQEYFGEMAGPLHTGTHGSCDCIHNIYTRSSQPKP